MSESSPTRIDLPAHLPALQAAVDWLVDARGTPHELDLSAMRIGVPGARAGRRLLELLVERCERDGRRLLPPHIATPGVLADDLLHDPTPPAPPMVRVLAWARALRERDREALAPVVLEPPQPDDWLGWTLLAEVFERLHTELAGHGYDFATVARRGLELPDFNDAPRWMAMAHVQAAYRRILQDLGLADPQERRERSLTLGDIDAQHDVVLVGVADMLPQVRRLFAAAPARLTVLVVVPDGMREAFDGDGCLRVPAWMQAEVPLRSDQLTFVTRPSDQAEFAAAQVAGLRREHAADAIVVGVPDPHVLPHLEQALDAWEVKHRAAGGTPVLESAPARVLAAAADLLERRSFRDLTAFVRHPDVERWLRVSVGLAEGVVSPAADWLSLLDTYVQRHLPHVMPEPWLGTPEEVAVMTFLQERIDGLLAPLRESARPLSRWARPMVDLLTTLFGTVRVDSDDPRDALTVAACEAVHAALVALHGLDARTAPAVRAPDAIRFVLRQLAGDAIPPASRHAAVELLGWLELALDDAPGVVLTGMNEGHVPESVNADPFLPNTLRRHLGLTDNDHRYARDVYALRVVLASRPTVQLVAGRVSADSDPLAPSRLLLACPPTEVAVRVARFYGEVPATQGSHAPSHGDIAPGAAALGVPRPTPHPRPITRIGVTWFKDYLACPYRFYLKRILKLDALDDHAREMDFSRFGILAHLVLQDFGASEFRDATEPDDIAIFLDQRLAFHRDEWFGTRPAPTARVQVEQLRERLHAFADWQAGWRREGWRIGAVELPFPDHYVLHTVGGIALTLSGRIDRVDIHGQTGEVVIFDYKTSDHPRTPESAHRTRGDWKDLQLPLYRYIVEDPAVRAALPGMAPNTIPRVGYINLPTLAPLTRARLAEWTESDFASARDTARTLAEQIHRQAFWPPSPVPPPFSEAFAAICQDGQLRDEDIGADEGAVES